MPIDYSILSCLTLRKGIEPDQSGEGPASDSLLHPFSTYGEPAVYI